MCCKEVLTYRQLIGFKQLNAFPNTNSIYHLFHFIFIYSQCQYYCCHRQVGSRPPYYFFISFLILWMHLTQLTALLHNLGHWFGITGVTLKWFKSYLQLHTQSASVQSLWPCKAWLWCAPGFCSGSTPFYFVSYIVPRSSMIGSANYWIPPLYANDTH